MTSGLRISHRVVGALGMAAYTELGQNGCDVEDRSLSIMTTVNPCANAVLPPDS